ncbi:MAG: GNAT family N-acetyltransferase [Candidatus Zixiibacteriota bacterium]
MTIATEQISARATILELERIERLAWAELYAVTQRDIVRSVGAHSFTIGSAVAGIASHIDVLAFNRVLGLGLGEAAGLAQIDDLIDAYTGAGARRFFVQLAPAVQPPDLPARLIERGFHHHNNWVKLSRNTGALPTNSSPVRVEQIGPERAAEFAGLFVAAFEWPDEIRPWVTAVIGRPGWRFYLAYLGDHAIATGAMFIDGPTAWLDFASTHSAFRGRGAQTALIQRRIRDAAAAGVQTLVTETAEDHREKPSISMHNLIRCGFEVAYLRPNYLFESGDHTGTPERAGSHQR